MKNRILGLALSLMATLSTGPVTSSAGWQIGTVVGAVLMAHGLVTLLAPRSDTEAPAPPAPLMVAPVALGDVARAPLPGVAVLGRF